MVKTGLKKKEIWIKIKSLFQSPKSLGAETHQLPVFTNQAEYTLQGSRPQQQGYGLGLTFKSQDCDPEWTWVSA